MSFNHGWTRINTDMKTETYMAVYKPGKALPTALFMWEEDAKAWSGATPDKALCRRRVIISPMPYTAPVPSVKESEAVRLLRILVTHGDDSNIGAAIEAGQKLLNIKPI